MKPKVIPASQKREKVKHWWNRAITWKKALISASLFIMTVLLIREAHQRYIYSWQGQQVVRIINERGSSGGTGFVLKHKGDRFIMTNKHVCAMQSDKFYLESGGEPEPLKIIASDFSHDLCLAEYDGELSGLSLSWFNPSVHTKTYVVGHPGLRNLTFWEGRYVGDAFVNVMFSCPKDMEEAGLLYIEMRLMELERQVLKSELLNQDVSDDVIMEIDALNSALLSMALAKAFSGSSVCAVSNTSMHMSAVAYPGNSGSPVINDLGQVTGVLFAGSRSEEHVSFAVPLETIKEFLNRLEQKGLIHAEAP